MSGADYLYLKNFKTIEIKAKQYAKRFPDVGFEEFLSQANFTFMNCMKNHKGISSFNTYLSRSLENELYKLVIEELYKPPIFVEISDSIHNEYFKKIEVHSNLVIDNLLDDLSSEAGEIINTIFSVSLKSITNDKNKITKKSLYDYLHRRKGWSIGRFKQCCWEIQRALKKEEAYA